ncbi:flagellar hook-length control protein FliK [Pseudoalteromonas sp. MMG007]|uniref:flagellar hook-length control protein FliK n=1 Tax=Pseudoalteromonas sp. MMG007 TaxID=2822684 RepID=UPI001B3680D9|nr:flagellar hook-length control protein FliK [Pseudoalteromonas sp. MMG007]MBQ4858006.1 flagellar hook-length control protein FliK [Pseudoalteromonas sp. MMG007]
MNTPTQITLSNSLVNNQTTNKHTNELTQLPDEVIAAKNIQFSKSSITLDVFVDKHWQTIRLSTSSETSSTQKIVSANIQLSPDGKQLTITPNNTTVSLNQPAQLQRLLNYINTGTEVESKPMPVQIVLSPSPKLVIEKLNASIAINKDVAQILSSEQPLKVIVSTNNKGAQLDVVNRFADTVHSQPLAQTKLTKLLTALLPSAELKTTPKLAILTHPQKQGSFTIPLNNKQVSELPNTALKVGLTSQADKVLIKTQINTMQVTLNNSFTKAFNNIVSAQPIALPSETLNNTPSPLISTNSPIKSWLQTSFSDFKTRINDAVKYFESRPFTHSSKLSLSANTTEQNQSTLTQALKQLDKPLITQTNITQHVDNALNKIKNPDTALQKHFNQLPALMQLTQLVKASVNVWQSSTHNAQQIQISLIPKDSELQLKTVKGVQNQLPSEIPSRSQMLQPIEAKLFSKLLSLPVTAPNIVTEKPLLSSQIAEIAHKATQNTPDLTRLVNQAFNRMVSSSNINPTTVQREILATIQPTLLSNESLQSSFSKGLEQVAVSILAAPIISQSVTPLTFNNQTGLDALLQVLIPTFKTGNSGPKILEQLQQAQVQALASEIVQVKNTLTQVSALTPNQQIDTNPLAQFLFPMKLPPEAGQTEITLGQYKKPSADKLEDKNVWFVRLNFDYAQLGQLQITAELMDKALDCQLLASSQEVTAIAHPHLDNLRSKLAKHGLQVGELNLKRGDAKHSDFYKSHAIINIKV